MSFRCSIEESQRSLSCGVWHEMEKGEKEAFPSFSHMLKEYTWVLKGTIQSLGSGWIGRGDHWYCQLLGVGRWNPVLRRDSFQRGRPPVLTPREVWRDGNRHRQVWRLRKGKWVPGSGFHWLGYKMSSPCQNGVRGQRGLVSRMFTVLFSPNDFYV